MMMRRGSVSGVFDKEVKGMEDRELFCELLKATGRPGVDKVLAGLEELGFFAAPASTRFHGSEPGGESTINFEFPLRVSAGRR